MPSIERDICTKSSKSIKQTWFKSQNTNCHPLSIGSATRTPSEEDNKSFQRPRRNRKKFTRKMKTIDSPEEVEDEQRRRPNTQLLLNYPVAFSFQPHVTNMLLTHFCPLIILIVAGSAVANCCFGSDRAWIDKIDVFRGRFWNLKRQSSRVLLALPHSAFTDWRQHYITYLHHNNSFKIMLMVSWCLCLSPFILYTVST